MTDETAMTVVTVVMDVTAEMVMMVEMNVT